MLREQNLFIIEYKGTKDPTDIKATKDFIYFFSSGRKGRNELGSRLTVAYIYTAQKLFIAAQGRKYYVFFSKSYQDTILNFINGREESGAFNLLRKVRPVCNFT